MITLEVMCLIDVHWANYLFFVTRLNAELLWVFLCVANSDIFDKMEHCRRQEDNGNVKDIPFFTWMKICWHMCFKSLWCLFVWLLSGCYCHALVHIIRSSQSIDLLCKPSSLLASVCYVFLFLYDFLSQRLHDLFGVSLVAYAWPSGACDWFIVEVR